MKHILVIGLLAAAHSLAAQTIVLSNATVIDGTGQPARRNVTIVVDGEHITDIFTSNAHAAPAGAMTLDLTGKFVIPGLIDSHVHLATDPMTTDARDQVERRLVQALYGGVTSVRDMAGDVRMLADLQRAAMSGEIESPSIHYSALWAGPAFFSDPRSIAMTRGLKPGTLPWALGLTDSTNLPLMVAAAKGSGATGIKIYAQVPGPLIARVVAEAHRQGMKVWAHARVGPASPAEVVAAGVDVASHADMFVCVIDSCARRPAAEVYEHASVNTPAVAQVIGQMKRRGTILDATLFVYDAAGSAPEAPPEVRARFAAAAKFAAAFAAAAYQAGVELDAGTDTIGDGDVGKYPNVHEELHLLVTRAGLSPLAAIRAGTLGGAKAIGSERTDGSIEVGKVADLVILEKDPLADISNTKSVRYVIHNGRLYTRR